MNDYSPFYELERVEHTQNGARGWRGERGLVGTLPLTPSHPLGKPVSPWEVFCVGSTLLLRAWLPAGHLLSAVGSDNRRREPAAASHCTADSPRPATGSSLFPLT